MSHPSTAPPLHAVVRPTTVIEAPRLSERLRARVILISEIFQWTGSFKFRAAYHLAASVPERKILTASSGNFGQALAYACQLLHKSCIVVMPITSAKSKINAVREYGGAVDLIDVTQLSRKTRVEQLAAEHPDAYVASAYDDPLVIEGNSSLGAELAALPQPFDAIVAPLGGGGLSSGILQGLRQHHARTPVWAAEPLLANDGARSLRAGRIVANEGEPQTIADGARTVSLGRHNWLILRDGLAGIIEVPEERIYEAARLLFHFANLKAEPTGALGVAALLHQPAPFRNGVVGCVVSGGNADADFFREALSG